MAFQREFKPLTKVTRYSCIMWVMGPKDRKSLDNSNVRMSCPDPLGMSILIRSRMDRWSYSRSCCLWLYLSVISLFFWITLKVSGLTLMSLIHFELILVQCNQQGSSSISVLQMGTQFYQHRILTPLLKITWL
jgi:hypothetical protein